MANITMYLFVCVLFVCCGLSQCFNIENRDPYVKKSQEANSYFGFSVALHKQSNSSTNKNLNWILVGAPKGQNLQPGTNASGALFKCPITSGNDDCVQVETDGFRADLEFFDYEDGENGNERQLSIPDVDEIKNGQWLGVTVKSQRPGGFVMVCAHRYIQSADLSKNHYGQGLCYLLNPDLTLKEALQYCKSLPKDKLHQQYGFCQIGTSIDFSGDGYALVGSPGPYTWRGTIFAQSTEGTFISRDKTIYKSPLSENAQPIDKYSYLGMSVAGGHFASKNKYLYVSGAPRSQMIGQVYFLERIPGYEELKIVLIITGVQFASSFGYEILVVDINNDGYDDLLVAAPFFYSDSKGGAVYIYSNLKSCLESVTQECKQDAVLYGSKQSRFGFAMTTLGDINKDGYNDVAIGAPYHNDHGAVYIFLGSADGLNKEPSQVLQFEKTGITTLGYSLSGGLDMDQNEYPDLLVGAYNSEMAMLFLTRPIIDISIQITSGDKNNINVGKKGCSADPYNFNNTCFSVESCFSMSGNVANMETPNIIFQINETSKFSRIWFGDEKYPDKRANYQIRSVSISNARPPYCQKAVVYLKEGISDILSPIKFTVKYSLEKDTPHSYILNKSATTHFEATFQKDCGDDDKCESNLNLDAKIDLNKNSNEEYTVESLHREFKIIADISNLGEAAYEAKLFVFHPKSLSYINVQTNETQVKCSVTDGVLICDLGNPFKASARALLNLRFQMTETPKEERLEILMNVNSTSKELSTKTDARLVAMLKKIASFNLAGKGTTNLFYGGEVIGESAMMHLEDIGARVTHRYFINNQGEWTLPQINVTIRWPYQVAPERDGEEGKWLLYLEDIPKVIGPVAGVCTVNNPTAVNPLKLELLHQLSSESLNMRPEEDDTASNSTYKRRRRRRDAPTAEKYTEITKEGIKRKIVVMDCGANARCLEIICWIDSLKQQKEAYIEVHSRIWNATLVEDYSNVDWVSIRSRAEIYISDETFRTNEDQGFSAMIETLAYPAAISAYSSINWWIIGIAIIAGLLLLVVLVVILYKCGFFKRKRVSQDPTLSGNLLSKEENSELLGR